MDSHQPADPWGIPEGAADDAEGVVATASKESPGGLLGSAIDPEPVELPEPAMSEITPDVVDEPADEEPLATADSADQEPVDEWAIDEGPDHEEPAADVPAEEADVAEPKAEAVDDGPKFDLGLDEDTSRDWAEPGGRFETGTAFDLIPPSSDGDEAPQYEVEEPELSETFVATSPEGRPDVGTPHLMDPDPLMAVPEETHPELSASEEPDDGTSSSFRLPGLFGRRKPADEPEPVEATEIDEPVVVEEPSEDGDEHTPPVPSAWGGAPTVGADDPASPFGDRERPEDSADTETVDEQPETADEPAEVEATDEEDDIVADLENVLELPVEPPTEAAAEGEDIMEIELTEPDLSELVDAEQLYVTEEAHEDRPPALLTVDSVPGATIAQAVDVVTAVASASTETEIADAMDRVLGQLRDKAHGLGGEAVISVHTEVQEMGGGFLVTGSGTAVTLA